MPPQSSTEMRTGEFGRRSASNQVMRVAKGSIIRGQLALQGSKPR
jgi:hypothetical protein